jgi:hypothetical protein
MKNSFNIGRISLLLKRYFLENMNREIMFWCMITFIFTMLDSRSFVIFVLFFSGLIYSIRLHNDLLKGTKGMHYLLIPATHSEKIAATIFLSTFYHFGMTIIAYSIGNLLITLTYHTILKMPVPVNWDLFTEASIVNVNGFIVPVMRNAFWSILGLFTFSQAVFILGSVYFNSNVIFKTILSVVGLGFVLFLIQVLIFKTIWDVKYLSNTILPMFVVITESTIPTVFKNAITIGSVLLIPFLWLVSYYRLSEKEI